MKYAIYKDSKLKVVEEDKKTLDFKALQKIVGGYIEMVALDPYGDSKGVDIVLNEEGKLLKLDPSLKWAEGRDVLCGDLVFVGVNNDGETIGLTDKQIEIVKEYVEENKLSDLERIHAKKYIEQMFG